MDEEWRLVITGGHHDVKCDYNDAAVDDAEMSIIAVQGEDFDNGADKTKVLSMSNGEKAPLSKKTWV